MSQASVNIVHKPEFLNKLATIFFNRFGKQEPVRNHKNHDEKS
jgi:hypothetical protein